MRCCQECGGLLPYDSPRYVTMHKACFAAVKRRELSDLRDEVAGLRIEVSRLRGRSALDAATLRRLLQLCHPDRHGGSALATETTAWLLDQRRMIEVAT